MLGYLSKTELLVHLGFYIILLYAVLRNVFNISNRESIHFHTSFFCDFQHFNLIFSSSQSSRLQLDGRRLGVSQS